MDKRCRGDVEEDMSVGRSCHESHHARSIWSSGLGDDTLLGVGIDGDAGEGLVFADGWAGHRQRWGGGLRR